MHPKSRNIFSRVLLLVIILFAFLLRIYKVTQIPPSLNWDEASIGYNAYSVLKTGRDEWGKFLPIHFKSYGEYKLPLQIYFSIPAIYIFGLNDFGVRITPVIYGTLTVLFAYFLAKSIFKSKAIGLITSLLVAVSPWHIQLTRGSFESSFALMWVMLAVLFLVKGFEKKIWWVLSVFFFAASIYTYNSARVFTPLFIFVNLFIFRKYVFKNLKIVAISFFAFLLLITPLVPFVLSGEGSARYKLVSITDEKGLVPRINEKRGNSKLPDPLPRLIHNRLTYISYYFIRNYVSHFTPDFLFISGAPHKQHHVQNMGELYLFQAPFLLIGLYLLIKNKQKFCWLILSWMFIAYIPVSTTKDSIPHALRTLIAMPTYQLITAYGIAGTYIFLKDRLSLYKFLGFWSLVVFFMLACFIYYLFNYFQIYPKIYSQDWQYGYKKVVSYIKNNYKFYDLIVLTRHYGEPHMFSLFYLNYDPEKFQNDTSLVRFETFDWVRVLKFDKFYFPDLGDKGTMYADILRENPDNKILFIGKPGDFPSYKKHLLQVNFLDGKAAFEIVSSP